MSEILQNALKKMEQRDQEMLQHGTPYTYTYREERAMKAHLFFPEGEKHEGLLRPCVVFFHGGLWDYAMPAQFVPHAMHFARRGAVTAVVETRLTLRDGTGPVEALEDAREFLRWLRANAEIFGFDPEKLVLAGASGGAWLALMSALPKTAVSEGSVKAMLLFSSLVNTAPPAQVSTRFPSKKMAKLLSPMRHVRRKAPAMLMFHSTGDRIMPFESVKKFCDALRSPLRRNQVRLLDFEKLDHGFFNFHTDLKYFELTLRAADLFLVELGLLEASEEDAIMM